MEEDDKKEEYLEEKNRFLKLVRDYSMTHGCTRFFTCVKDCLERTPVGENGIVTLKFEFVGPKDIGDDVFDIMYSTERASCIGLKRKMKYKYDCMKVDGVVYEAVDNPLEIEWTLNIGNIDLDKFGGKKDEAERKDSEPAKAD